jgi:hypothetical protein
LTRFGCQDDITNRPAFDCTFVTTWCKICPRHV